MHRAPDPKEFFSRLPDELVQKFRLAAQPAFARSMRQYAAAAAMLIAGKPGSEMHAPEPIIQVGFEATPDVVELMVAAAPGIGRDLIHIAIHPHGDGLPVGIMAVIYLDRGKVKAHRVSGLVCGPSSPEVVLAGIEDEDDQPCQFILRPGKKMVRVAGSPVDDLTAGLDRAGEFWHDLARSSWLGDCRKEIIKHYALLEDKDGSLVRKPKVRR